MMAVQLAICHARTLASVTSPWEMIDETYTMADAGVDQLRYSFGRCGTELTQFETCPFTLIMVCAVEAFQDVRQGPFRRCAERPFVEPFAGADSEFQQRKRSRNTLDREIVLQPRDQSPHAVLSVSKLVDRPAQKRPPIGLDV